MAKELTLTEALHKMPFNSYGEWRKAGATYSPPKNLEDVLAIIMPRFENFELKEDNEASFAIRYHHSIGQSIRNEFGLWGGSALKQYFETELNITEPDSMSDCILRAVYQKLKS